MLQKANNFISRFRWFIAASLLLTLIVFMTVYLIRPVTVTLLLKSREQLSAWQAIRHSEELPAEIERLDDQIVRLYSALQDGEGRLGFNEAQLLKKVYNASDSINFNVSKVEMGNPLSISGGHEYPIEITGTGNYNSVGQLISRIENLNRFTRVTYCTIKKEKGYNKLSLFLEFMVMEEL